MSDYLKREPTKNEKMIYELTMKSLHLDQGLMTNASQMCAMGILLKVDPKDMAELMVTKRVEIESYATKLNEELKKLYDAQKEKQPQIDTEDHTGHDHA